MTPFSVMIELCGLSLAEAAAFLDVRKDTAASWSNGRRSAGPDIINKLRELHDRIVDAAERSIDAIEAAPANAEIEIGYPADNTEAKLLGFPCVGAWRAMMGRVIADIDRPISLVPRGSTPGTAAAADAAGR